MVLGIFTSIFIYGILFPLTKKKKKELYVCFQ